MPTLLKSIIIFIVLALTFNNSASAAEKNSIDSSESKTIIVVRHAEKLDDGTRDPVLSKIGYQQAQALAEALSALTVSQAIASNYQRTQLTLKPLAAIQNIEVSIASTKDGIETHIAEIVALVDSVSGNSVIAGHSNTVPLIIKALGGPQIEALGESSYGGLYQLTINQSAEVEIEISRFGQ
ncbi:histidine phosphatase family protein [Shewanella sp. KX20019]|uniref:SixA phosphatase family protein n=1 Tax=Shewanella sp. KX20019 TaxID=2803864 RepID=UPI001928B9A8|nr:histidine phosphatase family protein [Shewanella sp. KX20019]QQX81186.1 histidine phosphatase family protein [Shewanella sp. KX20019]